MSETPKFTPGPWAAVPSAPEEGFNLWWLKGGGGEPLGSMSGYQSNREMQANAALASSAPDLYAALSEAEAFIAKASGGGETDLRAKLNAILARARGEAA